MVVLTSKEKADLMETATSAIINLALSLGKGVWAKPPTAGNSRIGMPDFSVCDDYVVTLAREAQLAGHGFTYLELVEAAKNDLANGVGTKYKLATYDIPEDERLNPVKSGSKSTDKRLGGRVGVPSALKDQSDIDAMSDAEYADLISKLDLLN